MSLGPLMTVWSKVMSSSSKWENISFGESSRIILISCLILGSNLLPPTECPPLKVSFLFSLFWCNADADDGSSEFLSFVSFFSFFTSFISNFLQSANPFFFFSQIRNLFFRSTFGVTWSKVRGCLLKGSVSFDRRCLAIVDLWKGMFGIIVLRNFQ